MKIDRFEGRLPCLCPKTKTSTTSSSSPERALAQPHSQEVVAEDEPEEEEAPHSA